MANAVTKESVVLSGIQNDTFESKSLQLYGEHVKLIPKERPKRGVVSVAASSVVQFRINTDTKEKATDICDELGMDLQTYLRMCMTRLVKDEGVPFDMSLKRSKKSVIFSELLREFNEDAKKNGTSEMTLEEINAEIDAARREREQ